MNIQNALLFVILFGLDFLIVYLNNKVFAKCRETWQYTLCESSKIFALVFVNFFILFLALRSLVYIDIANLMRTLGM